MPRAKKVKNEYDEFNKIKNYLIMSTPVIEVPQKMVYVNKNGDKKSINTLTKKGRLATRDKHLAINFLTNNTNNDIYVKNKGRTLSNQSSNLLNELHAVAIKKISDFNSKSDEWYKKARSVKTAKKANEYVDKINKHKDELKKYTRFVPNREYLTEHSSYFK